jgi:5'-methylthioadenosine phosphorylase
MCYAVMAHVTDYDVWHLTEEAVNVELVVKTLQKNTELAQESILSLVDILPEESSCSCSHALENAFITSPAAISSDAKNRLGLLVDKYLK